jgi:type IV fimbrial biogenesis protein FimT
MKARRTSSGFTLVELMITVVVIAILAAIATPSFNSTIEGQRVRAASTDIYTALAIARSEAIKRNTNITLAPKSEWSSGWTITDPVSNTAIEDHDAFKALTIAGPGSVTYQASGRIQGGAGTSFTVTGATTGAARCITIDLSGRPNTKAGSC